MSARQSTGSNGLRPETLSIQARFLLDKAKLLLSLQKPQAAISVLDQAYALSPFDHEISLLKSKKHLHYPINLMKASKLFTI